MRWSMFPFSMLGSYQCLHNKSYRKIHASSGPEFWIDPLPDSLTRTAMAPAQRFVARDVSRLAAGTFAFSLSRRPAGRYDRRRRGAGSRKAPTAHSPRADVARGIRSLFDAPSSRAAG